MIHDFTNSPIILSKKSATVKFCTNLIIITESTYHPQIIILVRMTEADQPGAVRHHLHFKMPPDLAQVCLCP